MLRWFQLSALLAALVSAAACQRSDPAEQRGQEPGAPASLSAYGRDIERICNCEERSGASQRPEAERMIVVAQWLGKELETDEGRRFMARFSQATPADKAALLEAESRRQGLASCPLVRAWASGLPE